MYLRDVLTSLRRRWLFVVAAFVVAIAAVAGLSTVVKPSYASTASVVLVPPNSKDDPTGNRYMNLGSLGGAVEVLSRSLSSADTMAAMQRVAPGATYTAALDPSTSAPVVAIATSAPTPTAANGLLQALLTRIPDQLVSLQQSVNVPKSSRITSLVVSQDKKPAVVQKARIRLLGVAFIGILGLLILAIAAVDGLLVRRGRRGRPARESAAATNSPTGSGASPRRVPPGRRPADEARSEQVDDEPGMRQSAGVGPVPVRGARDRD